MLVHRGAYQRKGQRADLTHGHAIGEDPDALEPDAASRLQRLEHRVGFVRLHAEDPYVRPERLHVTGDPGDQAAAADRHEDRGDVAEAMPQDLIADRPLARDDEVVVERRHERHAGRLRQLVAVRLRVLVGVAGQDDVGAEVADRLDLDLRRRLRHDDERAQAEVSGGERHALRVVAGARGNHAGGPLRLRQVRNAVIGAAQLEAEDRLQVFPLEADIVAQPLRQPRGALERGLVGDVVDAAGQDQAEQGRDVRRDRYVGDGRCTRFGPGLHAVPPRSAITCHASLVQRIAPVGGAPGHRPGPTGLRPASWSRAAGCR